jgi:1,4-alpha-glucan branching enzyme
LQYPEHAGLQHWVRDLNRLYQASPALYSRDFSGEGFEWIAHDDAQHSTLCFVRKGQDGSRMLVICNFAPAVHQGLRVGVPAAGQWLERLNSDSSFYGGSNAGTPLGGAQSAPIASHGRADSILITLPPLATVFFEWTA